MPRYAVKIAEILIVSDEAITAEQRNEIGRLLKIDPARVIASGVVEVRTTHLPAKGPLLGS